MDEAVDGAVDGAVNGAVDRAVDGAGDGSGDGAVDGVMGGCGADSSALNHCTSGPLTLCNRVSSEASVLKY